jgi:large subunit ribosomal protein L37Ae
MAEDDPKSIKKFGARYGRTTKLMFGLAERKYNKPIKCPYCHMIKVRRLALGIWHCNKCDSKFTGKAYTI